MTNILAKFSKYTPDDAARRTLESATEYSLKIDKARRIIEARISFPEVIPHAELYAIEAAVRESYELSVMKILPSYPPESFSVRNLPDIFNEAVNVGAVANGFFDDYTVTGTPETG